MEQNQTDIKQHARRNRCHHHLAFAPALNVVARQYHRRDLQPGSGAHQNPGEAIGKAKIAADPQRHINDIHGIAGPHQRGGDKQHAHVFIVPSSGLHQHVSAFRRLLNAGDRGQFDGDQRQTYNKDPGGNRKHGGEAIIQRQHKCQRWTNDPRQRKLRTHYRTEHHHFARRAIGIFPRQGKKLRHRGIRHRGQHNPAGNQRQIVAIKSEQQRVSHRHQAAKHNQPPAIAPAVGALSQRQADQYAGNGVNRIEQSYPERLRAHFTAEE